MQLVHIATLDLPDLRSFDEFANKRIPTTRDELARSVLNADNIATVFPRWLGTISALLKAFLEQLARPDVAFAYPQSCKRELKIVVLESRRHSVYFSFCKADVQSDVAPRRHRGPDFSGNGFCIRLLQAELLSDRECQFE